MVFVVEGRLTLELDGAPIELAASSHVFDSARPHAFANRTQVAVRFFRCTAW